MIDRYCQILSLSLALPYLMMFMLISCCFTVLYAYISIYIYITFLITFLSIFDAVEILSFFFLWSSPAVAKAVDNKYKKKIHHHHHHHPHKAGLVSDLAKVADLLIMNWQPGVSGKWTWDCENRRSVLDYILTSKWWVERTSWFSINDGRFL